MRILQVHNRYRSAAPSGENRVVDREGAALTALGHEVTTFGPSSDEIEGWSGRQKAALPARVVWSRSARRDLGRELAARQPDVVHVHNTFPLLSPSVLGACRNAGVPVVATLHNYKLACASGDFFRNGAVCHDCAGRLPIPALVHGCYRGSRAATAPVALNIAAHRSAWRSMVSAYLFISAAQRDLLSGLGLPSDRVFVRHNMIPRRDGLGRPHGPVVVYAGRLDEAKGLRVLMAGWDSYLAGSPGGSLRLLIVGTGPLEPEIAAWATGRPSVELAGQVSGDRCAEIMAGARAVVVPSAWEETFGLVVVEAMSAGVPPIAAGHGSLPELITNGADGVLFAPGDPAALGAALADAEASPGQYEKYGAAARETYQRHFDPAASIARLMEIYRFAIDNPAR
jgi:glycosyltransferase involved in cell wall biosynthesis